MGIQVIIDRFKLLIFHAPSSLAQVTSDANVPSLAAASFFRARIQGFLKHLRRKHVRCVVVALLISCSFEVRSQYAVMAAKPLLSSSSELLLSRRTCEDFCFELSHT